MERSQHLLDEYDLEILKILEIDGRSSCAEIGRRLNLSRVAIRDRIARLEKEGDIERFTVIINPQALGRTLSVFFSINCIPSKLIPVAEALAQNADILSVNQMSGNSTLHCHAALKDNEHLEYFLNNVIYELPGILSVETSILLRSFKAKAGGIKITR